MLGFVDRQVQFGGPVQAPYSLDSKIGGHPIWHHVEEKDAVMPRCRKCGGHMSFICQVYAPTELHRSLYIYCCENSKCVLHSNGWTVLRSQRPVREEEKQLEVVEPPEAPNGPTFSSVFDANSWCNVEGNDNDLDDLEALLQQRDDAMKDSSTDISKGAIFSGAPVDSSRVPVQTQMLKEFIITQADEPDPATRSSKKYNSGGASDEHIMGLVSRYIAEERESQHDEASTPSDLASLRLIEESIKRGVCGAVSDNDDDDYDSDSEKKLVRKQSKIEVAFQRHLSLASQQVLRYAYGGEPLWCSDKIILPGPSEDHGKRVVPVEALRPPRCEACGGERVFEMQLMPALADYIIQTSSLPPAASSADIYQTLKIEEASREAYDTKPDLHGLNVLKLSMGVLCIWSCANSCIAGSQEYAIFQPLE